jgi:hypothetical protein
VKRACSLAYRDLVVAGRWFSPAREAIDALVARAQARVSGTVRLSLGRGACHVTGGRAARRHCNSHGASAARPARGPRGSPPDTLMSTLWSGRFDTPPDAALFAFGESFSFDRALFEDDVTGSLAWADALRGAGVLSDEDAAAIVDALQAMLERGRHDPAFVSGPTRTSTRSSSASWWSASAMRASGCTPAGRATSRSRSTCGSTCAAGSPCCRPSVAAWRHSSTSPAGPGPR